MVDTANYFWYDVGMDEFLHMSEAAKRMQISRTQLWLLIRDGLVPARVTVRGHMVAERYAVPWTKRRPGPKPKAREDVEA